MGKKSKKGVSRAGVKKHPAAGQSKARSASFQSNATGSRASSRASSPVSSLMEEMGLLASSKTADPLATSSVSPKPPPLDILDFVNTLMMQQELQQQQQLAAVNVQTTSAVDNNLCNKENSAMDAPSVVDHVVVKAEHPVIDNEPVDIQNEVELPVVPEAAGWPSVVKDHSEVEKSTLDVLDAAALLKQTNGSTVAISESMLAESNAGVETKIVVNANCPTAPLPPTAASTAIVAEDASKEIGVPKTNQAAVQDLPSIPVEEPIELDAKPDTAENETRELQTAAAEKAVDISNVPGESVPVLAQNDETVNVWSANLRDVVTGDKPVLDVTPLKQQPRVTIAIDPVVGEDEAVAAFDKPSPREQDGMKNDCGCIIS